MYIPYEFPSNKAGWRKSQLEQAGIEGYEMEFQGPVVVIYIPVPMEKRAEKAFAYKKTPGWRKSLNRALSGAGPFLRRAAIVLVVLGVGYGVLRSGVIQDWLTGKVKDVAEEAVVERTPDVAEPVMRWFFRDDPDAETEQRAPLTLPSVSPAGRSVADSVGDLESSGGGGKGLLLLVLALMGVGGATIGMRAGVFDNLGNLGGIVGAATGAFRGVGERIAKTLR